MKPVSRTAFYCTGVRALDARTPHPICGDQYAERFMNEEAWDAFQPFRGLTAPNISNATRHRVIDDLLRERLRTSPGLRVVIIGAGFDSRAFRLPAGRWLEVDEPQVFAWKEPRLPAADCPNPLTRLAVDFSAGRLRDELAPFADEGPVTVVVEGVLMYLGDRGIRDLVATVRQTFPRGEILCDVMRRDFFERFGQPIHRKIVALGASFELPSRPVEELFAEGRYVETARISLTRTAAALGRLPWFMRLFTYLSRTFVNGYTVRVFRPA